jgi:hypothetical protein
VVVAGCDGNRYNFGETLDLAGAGVQPAAKGGMPLRETTALPQTGNDLESCGA